VHACGIRKHTVEVEQAGTYLFWQTQLRAHSGILTLRGRWGRSHFTMLTRYEDSFMHSTAN
jgi:hypothetical protein